jgi:N-acetylglucosamine malate deacetylase 1
LLRHKADGDDVFWGFATEMKEGNTYYSERVSQRKSEIKKVASLYQFDDVLSLGFFPATLDTIATSNLVDKISDVMNRVKPNIIYLPFFGDIHSDHQVFFSAALSCTKWFRYPFVESIYMMEVLSETNFSLPTQGSSFVPNFFVDITPYYNKKVEIMNLFKSEMGVHPFPRSLDSIKALAVYRGSMSGCEMAESFMLLKHIKK